MTRVFPEKARENFPVLARELFISRAKTKKFTHHVFRGDKPEILGA
ncbi:hypothetical protein HMPREF1990_01592 [Porphyromonas gingivalis W4087]|nr:hypothetical protein HMPREF1990_01592 [Porphyromonas gingivalis W4087]